MSMKHRLTVVAAALVLVGALAVHERARAEPPPAEPAALPACVKLTGESRLAAYGFNHVVRVENACAQDADCLVATSVDPTPSALKVSARASAELVVRVGSPARVFTPIGTCKLVGR